MTALGVVSSGSTQSTEAATDAFRAGGNAVDAVLAAAFATGGGDPAITSLAGGGILVFRDARTGVTEVCDFFADAPGLGGKRGQAKHSLPELDFRSLEIDFFTGGALQTFHVGRGSAAVPGVLPGLYAAGKRWGRLDLAELVKPWPG